MVDALGHELGLAEHEDPAESAVPSGVPDHPATHPDERAVALQAQLHVLHLAPAVRQRHHVLRAGLDPLDGPAELECELGRDDAFGRQVLRPERSTDVRRDHAHPLGLHPQQPREDPVDHVRHLAGQVHGQVEIGPGRVDDDRAPLHRHHGDPLVLEAASHDDVGAGERVFATASQAR